LNLASLTRSKHFYAILLLTLSAKVHSNLQNKQKGPR
jgi:RNA polymerase sigma-70 factor, ECF subfamily